MKALVIACVLALLAACGGGGGASVNSTSPVSVSSPAPLVIIDGDSLADITYPATTWSLELQHEIPRAEFSQVAVASSRAAVEIIGRYDAKVHPFAGHGGVYILVAGTNDVRRDVPLEDAWSALTTLWARAHADGFKVIAVTVGPLSTPVVPSERETARVELNARIRANAQLYDALIDLDRMFPDANDRAMLVDGLHFGTRGNQAVLGAARGAVETLGVV